MKKVCLMALLFTACSTTPVPTQPVFVQYEDATSSSSDTSGTSDSSSTSDDTSSSSDTSGTSDTSDAGSDASSDTSDTSGTSDAGSDSSSSSDTPPPKNPCVGTVCYDGNPCTQDGCSEDSGCTFKPSAAGLCDDGNACTYNTVCSQGQCLGGATKVCDDGNACTDDFCDEKSGCTAKNNTQKCDDGNACTTEDVCGNGTCAGKGNACDDGNACTEDLCNGADGSCINPTSPSLDGTPCGSGSICSQSSCKSLTDVCEAPPKRALIPAGSYYDKYGALKTSKSYYISKSVISVAEYSKCVNDGECVKFPKLGLYKINGLYVTGNTKEKCACAPTVTGFLFEGCPTYVGPGCKSGSIKNCGTCRQVKAVNFFNRPKFPMQIFGTHIDSKGVEVFGATAEFIKQAQEEYCKRSGGTLATQEETSKALYGGCDVHTKDCKAQTAAAIVDSPLHDVCKSLKLTGKACMKKKDELALKGTTTPWEADGATTLPIGAIDAKSPYGLTFPAQGFRCVWKTPKGC